MLEDLKQIVYDANMALVKHGLVIFTWGNVSGIDREKGLVVIKPSGVEYDKLSKEDMTVIDLNGNIVEGKWKPSSDTPTHLALYKGFPEAGGVVHTHSTWATSCAQAGVPITPLGTTHADNFYSAVPVTRSLSAGEIETDYEYNTGLCIVETINGIGLSSAEMPAVLVRNHGPFTWGKTPDSAVEAAVILEETAKMFALTRLINTAAPALSQTLLDKHFLRKHGKNAYYGQGK